MNEDQIKRNSKRDDVLDSLNSKVVGLEEIHGESEFDYALIRALLIFLQDKHLPVNEHAPEVRFLKETLVELSEFARSVEERDLILVELLLWLTKSICGQATRKYTEVETKDRQKVP